MKLRITSLAAIAALTLAGPASAASTLLFADNFNESPASEVASTFNNNLAATQSGSIGTTTYSVLGSGNAAQHSNGGNQLTLANFAGFPSTNTGRVSLDNNFATQANSLNQALVFSFQIKSITNFAADTENWGSFTVGSTQNPFVTSGYAGAIFRANGATQSFAAGNTPTSTAAWNADDYVTITLSGLGGIGSAFSTNGSEAKIQIGSNVIGTYNIGQQSVAYLTFGVASPQDFGVANFDNLSVTAIPEPGAALLGGLGLLALLRRRRH